MHPHPISTATLSAWARQPAGPPMPTAAARRAHAVPQSRTPIAHVLMGALAIIASASLAAAQPPAAAAREGAAVQWTDQPTLRLGDHVRIDLHARLQSDFLVRNEADADAGARSFDDRLSVPRKRIGIDGVLFERIEFQAERELRDDNPWRDVYADVRVHRSFRVRAGHFKVPFSLEQLTAGHNLDFVARAAPVVDLSPGRDIGVMVHGRVADRALKYEAGLFEADGATRLWAADRVKTLAARVTVAPLEDGRSRGSDRLQVSAALLRTDLPEGRMGPSGHLVMGDTFFPRLFVNGTRTRLGAGLEAHTARASVAAELIRSIDTRRGQAVDNGDLSDLVVDGGYASLVWHVVPRRRRGGGDFPLRALDVAARFDRLSFGGGAPSDDAFLNPRADHVAPIGKDAWTLGLNWHVSQWVKIQANTVREQVLDPLELLPISATPLWSTVLRFQIGM